MKLQKCNFRWLVVRLCLHLLVFSREKEVCVLCADFGWRIFYFKGRNMTEKELIRNACRPFDEVWFEVGYRIKVIELSNNRKAKREFTNREMAFNCFNPRLAKEYLSSEEYSNLLKVLDYYSDDKTFSFNYKEWREHIVQIIASYDLVAPYYKFGTIKTDESLEKFKLKFRERI